MNKRILKLLIIWIILNIKLRIIKFAKFTYKPL